jgi:hypothetical protein
LNSHNISQKKAANSRLFETPWKYREGFIIALALLILGFIIEIITPQPGISIPSFPFNMYAGMAFITTIAFLHIFYRDIHMVRWLSTIPAATSSICLIVLLTILMGVFQQDDPDAGGLPGAIGLTHLKNAWPFLMAQLYVLTSLGLVIMRRSFPLKKKNIGFILNHAGLWIVIAAASLGTGDLRRLRMDLHIDDPVWYAYDDRSHVHELPFALELVSFDIDEYPPQLAILDSHTGRLSDPDQRPLPYIEAGKTTSLMDWDIYIEEFYTMAMEVAGDREQGELSHDELPGAGNQEELMEGRPPEPSPDNQGKVLYSEETGAPPFASVTAVNRLTGETKEGWISCGSFMFDARYLWLDGKNVLVMTLPEPRKYQSTVIARTMRDEPRELIIEVNKPPRVAGWRLYQLSYNQNMGKWSNLSVLEVVRDPWLPVVYVGFIMLLAGAVYIFWIGKDTSAEESSENNEKID